MIWSESRSTSEAWVLDAEAPESVPRSVGGRRHGVLYRVEHAPSPAGDRLLVVTNDGAVEFRLMTAPVPLAADVDHSAWVEARPEHPDERLWQADAFADGVVLSYRSGGAHRLRVVRHDDLAGPGRVLSSRYQVGCLDLSRNELYDAPTVTVADESYLRPPVWSTVDLRTGERVDVHRAEAPGFDPDAYAVERRTFASPDGTQVPAVLVRRHDTPLDGTAPCLIYAYGSYEAVDEPEWDAALPALLDRGVVWVHAHPRGGGERGRRWWLDGSLRHKQHTFDDLAAVADGLDREGLVDGTRIATRGLSAGGLLQGALFSQRPERWRAVVAEVPFVDVVTTMFDETIPLTINEWEEWGDPRVREEFDWMLAYSPYDHLPPAGSRPDLLVTGAVHDPRVMVREPAKWVAALRESDPEWSPRCLFRCETGAGAHVGPSGRTGHLGYEAEVYAWVLDRLGVADERESPARRGDPGRARPDPPRHDERARAGPGQRDAGAPSTSPTTSRPTASSASWSRARTTGPTWWPGSPGSRQARPAGQARRTRPSRWRSSGTPTSCRATRATGRTRRSRPSSTTRAGCGAAARST